MLAAVAPRAALDRCPGLLRPFLAADGALVRLRVPGGRLPVVTLTAALSLAEEHGAPLVQLTTRANLQVRALPDPLPAAFVGGVESLGLLPSATHERVRNILAAPLAAGLRPLVEALDRALMADRRLADLPGRFLFAVSDASGSVLGEPWDVAYQQLSPTTGRLLVGDRGLPVAPAAAVEALVSRALAFLATRSGPGVWGVRDLPRDGAFWDGLEPARVTPAAPLAPGPAGPDLVAGVPLGFLRRAHVAALAAVTDDIVLTPWRSVVVPGGAGTVEALRAAGLVTRADDPASRLSACVGAPGCGRSRSHTVSLATTALARLGSDTLPGGARVHVVGCERRCGARDHDTVLIAPDRPQAVVDALRCGPEHDAPPREEPA